MRRSVAEMRRLATLLLTAFIALPACSSTGAGDASVDVMFRKTDVIDEDILELTTPALVNEINGAYEIEGIGYMPGAKLSAGGEVESGDNRVFVLRFVDLGDISVLRTDDKQVSLRAEFGPEGKVVNALLGSPSGAVSDAFVSSGNDVFESGTWEVMYDGPDLVVGRFDLKFRKYRVAGNFRAPRLK
jgi:hypothetical protein